MRLDALLRAHGFMRVERPSGAAAWDADAAWHPGRPWALRSLEDLTARLAPAGVRFAYVRRLPPRGSLTIFLPRLVNLPNAGPGAHP